jgi:hypothetical protein
MSALTALMCKHDFVCSWPLQGVRCLERRRNRMHCGASANVMHVSDFSFLRSWCTTMTVQSTTCIGLEHQVALTWYTQAGTAWCQLARGPRAQVPSVCTILPFHAATSAASQWQHNHQLAVSLEVRRQDCHMKGCIHQFCIQRTVT